MAPDLQFYRSGAPEATRGIEPLYTALQYDSGADESPGQSHFIAA
ncbi:MAG: hypothetical protein JWN67_4131 [Actinomycetia bacterium]|nr:hypothetical protein [Actinomycetes bacterium]